MICTSALHQIRKDLRYSTPCRDACNDARPSSACEGLRRVRVRPDPQRPGRSPAWGSIKSKPDPGPGWARACGARWNRRASPTSSDFQRRPQAQHKGGSWSARRKHGDRGDPRIRTSHARIPSPLPLNSIFFLAMHHASCAAACVVLLWPPCAWPVCAEKKHVHFVHRHLHETLPLQTAPPTAYCSTTLLSAHASLKPLRLARRHAERGRA